MEVSVFFFFNDTATTEIYTLSLHDALPISSSDTIYTKEKLPEAVRLLDQAVARDPQFLLAWCLLSQIHNTFRSEEHTSELQSQSNLVCRLLLEKKRKRTTE